MKALITGINGFAGSYLAEALLKAGYSVIGLVQPGTSLSNISAIKDRLSLFEVDLLAQNDLGNIISKISADVVFHLAGASSVKESFEQPSKYFEVNVIGGLNLLASCKKALPKSRILLITSGEVYGESLGSGEKTNESAPLIPKSPYAASKAALDMLGRIYHESSGQDIIIARPFNHIGNRQADMFFVPAVARQVAEIVNKKRPNVIELGDIDVYRDFTDVRDMAQAYIALAQKGIPGKAYNICSGNRYLLRDIVNELIRISGIKIEIRIDPARLRKSDIKDIRVDNSLLIKETGWKPRIRIEDSLSDIYQYWLEKTK